MDKKALAVTALAGLAGLFIGWTARRHGKRYDADYSYSERERLMDEIAETFSTARLPSHIRTRLPDYPDDMRVAMEAMTDDELADLYRELQGTGYLITFATSAGAKKANETIKAKKDALSELIVELGNRVGVAVMEPRVLKKKKYNIVDDEWAMLWVAGWLSAATSRVERTALRRIGIVTSDTTDTTDYRDLTEDVKSEIETYRKAHGAVNWQSRTPAFKTLGELISYWSGLLEAVDKVSDAPEEALVSYGQ